MKTDPPPAKRAAKKSGGKVFDVRRPGRALASSTSKPVIGYQPVIKDPAVTMNGIGESRELLDSRQKINIAPADEDVKPVSPSVGKGAAVEGTPAAARIRVNRAEPEAVPITPAQAFPATPPGELHGNEVFSLGGTTGVEEPTAAPATPPPNTVPAPAGPIDQSDEPGFVVSHHDTPQKRSSQTITTIVLFIVMIVLALVAVDILLDANILHLSGVPHTELLR